MSDKKIFFAPSDPPRVLSWGENRAYFFNCHGEEKDYDWHRDNLELAQEKPEPNEITIAWTFNNKWDPLLQLNTLLQNL